MLSRKGQHLIFMEAKICSFFGHREIEATEKLKEALREEILKAIDLGCRIFYFGGFGAFDALCHKILTKIKEENADLRIERVYCVASEYYLRKRHKYLNVEDYEDVMYLKPDFDGWHKRIYFRNCAMIDASHYVIFYAESRAESGAYKAYKYAEKKKKNLINLYKKELSQG